MVVLGRPALGAPGPYASAARHRVGRRAIDLYRGESAETAEKRTVSRLEARTCDLATKDGHLMAEYESVKRDCTMGERGLQAARLVEPFERELSPTSALPIRLP
jgi:hypothetical protein